VTRDDSDPLDKKKLRRTVFRLTWPAFIELFMVTLFGMVDMMMVGQLGPAAIAAVGLTNQPFRLLLAIFSAVNVGATTLVAWKIGAGRYKEAKTVTRQIIVLNLFLGLAISAVGIVYAPYVIRFMGANADTYKLALTYFQIVAAGLVFQAISMGVTACLRGAGETKIPMLYNVVSNLLNVFGNYALIYGKFGMPRLEVAGAALSTTIACALAFLASLYVLFVWRKSKLSMKPNLKFRFDWSVVGQVFKIGIPAAGEQFVIQGGLMFFVRIVAGLGTSVYAAHQIGLNISGLTFAPSMAFGVAATALVGQSLGAGREKRAEEYANIIHNLALGAGCFMGLIFILFSHQLARLYTQDLAVIAMSGTVLKILALAQPGQSTQLSLAGALRGAGDTVYPLYASLVGIWAIRLVFSHLFVNVFHWGLVGAWLALASDQYVRSFVVYIRYRSGKWKEISRAARARKAQES